jgi:hypothetical protein
MNSLPNELRTPPLPVIAFIGCSELHKDVGSYFNHTIRPPFFSVGLAEANESLLVRLFGECNCCCSRGRWQAQCSSSLQDAWGSINAV